MKRSFFVSLALLVFVFGAAGCASVQTPLAGPRKNTVALSISVNGTDQPNPAQWAALVASLEPELKAKGWVLVHDLSTAAQILRVNFIPDFMAPDASGRIVVIGLMTNPRTAIAANTAFRSVYSSGFSTYSRNSFYDPFESNYYRNNNFISETSFTPPPMIVTPPSNIPHCPPDVDRPSRPHRGGGDGNYARRDNPDSGWNSYREPTYSQPSYSSPEPSYNPPPAPAPEPVSSGLNYTPSADSSPATHPTSG
jgi:hypothetical protein